MLKHRPTELSSYGATAKYLPPGHFANSAGTRLTIPLSYHSIRQSNAEPPSLPCRC
jgi:hypothetical protein